MVTAPCKDYSAAAGKGCLEVQQKFGDNKHISKTGMGESQVGNECRDDLAKGSFESNDKVVCCLL